MTELTEPSSRPKLKIEAVAKTTFAAAQNHVPVLRQIVISNPSSQDYRNLRIEMRPQPAFCKSKDWIVDLLPASGEISIGDLQVTLDFAVLDRLNEAENGQLVFRLFDEEKLLDEHFVPIELLARDEWGGSSEMSQILAAFISPNHPQVAQILKDASRLLEKGGHNGALDGYQSRDPRRAYMLAAAIWSAVSAIGISYAQPPRSFESQGQKIRDPGTIVKAGLATCLDTTLLLAAAFEAVKLNPVVVFTNGHAFVGTWIVEKVFPTTVESDVTEIRKAVSSKEFLVLESTLLTHRPVVGFEQAMANGSAQLSEDREHEFRMAIDVARARAAGIRPISNLQLATIPLSGVDDTVAPASLPKMPSFDMIPAEYAEELAASPSDRLERWQKKLLDLSLRNRLLNFSDTRQTLSFVCADVPSLEDALAGGKKFRVISLKDEDPIGNRDPKLYKQQTGRDIQHDFAATAFSKGQVCANESGKEMQSRLTTLYRKAKSDLAEGGTNTLFMAVGFLKWRKDPKDSKAYKAPLMLLPIRLTRRSAKSGYYISHHQDDVVFNQTLLEYLEQEFGFAVPTLRGSLPTDDSGLDIKLIFQLMEQAVRQVPGFEVVEDIAVSTFSFAKYLMWKDLVDRTDSLKNNRLVRHLLDNPTERFADDGGEFPQPQDIDQQISPSTIFTPLPADSSQLAAVVAAESGKDFVVIGPPGTGKSQTIANMIAHCLAHGKTVLFVAEKSAALDVVYRRLKAYGLADACLELHSNKTDRKSVITQLGAAWDRSSKDTEEEWVRLTETLKVQRDELNLYVEELHNPGSHGYSVYEAIGILTGNEPKFELGFFSIDSHDSHSFESLAELSERLGLTHSAVADCRSLNAVVETEWSFSWQKDLLNSAVAFRDDVIALKSACNQFLDHLCIEPKPDYTNVELLAFLNLAKSIAAVSKDDYRFASSDDLETMERSVTQIAEHTEVYSLNKSLLEAGYEDQEILRIPIEDIDRDWRIESSKLWPFSFFGKRKVQKLLQSYAFNGSVNPETDIAALLKIKEALDNVSTSPLAPLPSFEGIHSDVKQLENSVRQSGDLKKSIKSLSRLGYQQTKLAEAIGQILPPNSESVSVAVAARELREARQQFDQSGKAYLGKTGGTKLTVTTLQGVVNELEGITKHAHRLNDWVKWSKIRKEASDRGLGPMVDALESGQVEDPKADFLVAYFDWWLPRAIDLRPKLRDFAHWEQENQIERFRELIESVQDLAALQVRRAISHGLPTRDGVPRNSELGMLRHQLGLQRPSQSIRGLIQGMPDSFTKLTPCVLMSPLSVAQYLPAEQASFDMVIFDEASQITTWDAVGAIARGTQSIIVGDPKQLPPTNFFGRTNDEEEEELAIHERDLASILDEASAAGLPLHQLNWHYRSRDEDLIAFSNHHYYGHRLVTFPSPKTDSNAVQFHKINGVYARGSGRTNEIEAKAIVQYMIERLLSWVDLPEDERLSIGVITFNAPQQELILDLLDAERSKYPGLEWFFSEEREEPVIVKNLENIQGDERDVMIFSITFGRDNAGKLPMDFGAVNKQGGEKRLNVAVTRAKSEFHVFSSISAEDIDPRRAKGLGVQHLKNYLDYAQRGAVALPAMDEGSLGPAENMFEESVAEALRSRGWEVRTQIGVSGYRIDLGVVHPEHAGSFLAGVECDGATYHSSATARDRDQIREGVLRHLGWEILRVWSTDWFMHPIPALDRLDETLRELLENSRVEESTSDEQDSSNLEIHCEPTQVVNAANVPDEYVAGVDEGQYASNTPGSSGSEVELVVVDDDNQPPQAESSRFFDSTYTGTLESIINNLVSQLSPISETMLFRAVAQKHDWQRAGKRIRERVVSCLGENECHEENGNVFIWAPGTFKRVIPYRASLKRPSREVPQSEIFGLIEEYPNVRFSDDPAKSIASLMGLGRLSEDTRKYLETCVEVYRKPE